MCSRQVGPGPLLNADIKTIMRFSRSAFRKGIDIDLNIDIAVHVGDFLPRRPAEEVGGGLSQGEVSWEF